VASVKRNILSNVAERACSTLLTLLLVPIQVRILGIETFGLLAFVASLQALFNLLDLGLGTTVTREVAADTDPHRCGSRAVVRTFATVYWTVAIGVGVGLALGARWLAVEWLQAGTLDPEEVVAAIRLVAVSVALRWPVALYAGILSGVQRLDVLNFVRITGSVLRLAGGLAVILWSRSLTAYLVWLAMAAVVEIALYVAASLRFAGEVSLWPGFSTAAVRRVWRFSLGMNAMSILILVLNQSDRLLIARLLPIEALGHYSVAHTLAAGLSVVHGTVTTALFPALARSVTRGADAAVSGQHAKGGRLLMYLVSLPASGFVFYAPEMLHLWVSTEAAGASARALALLAVGFWLNAAVSISYTLAIAAGATRVPVTIHVVGALMYVPLLYLSILHFGIDGAPVAWVALNVYYILVLLPWALRSVARQRPLPWASRNLAPFVLIAVGCLGGARAVLDAVATHDVAWRMAGASIGAGLYLAAGFSCLGPELRRQVGLRLRRRPVAAGAAVT